jgi:hypothetical protein
VKQNTRLVADGKEGFLSSPARLFNHLLTAGFRNTVKGSRATLSIFLDTVITASILLVDGWDYPVRTQDARRKRGAPVSDLFRVIQTLSDQKIKCENRIVGPEEIKFAFSL